MSNKFCTVDDVHPHLNNVDGWDANDELIAAQILNATALLRVYTRREWTKGVYEDFFNTPDVNRHIGSGRNVAKFTLTEKPISKDLSEQPVVRYSSSGSWEDSTDLTPSNYQIDHRKNQIIIYPETMRSAARSLRVIYTAGYPVNATDTELLDVAPNLRQACAIQAADRTRHIINETSGKKMVQNRKGLANFAMTSSGLVYEALALVKSETRILVGS